ncbi:MAG TPA: hypothetical protein ENJ37_09390 [Deltaproteobacteria bacterium]|nr:hypothetical protein [Deltaproteobacteria bacterium]
MTDIYSQQRRNRRTTIVLMAAFVVLIVSLGLSIDIYNAGGLDGLRFPAATAAAFLISAVNLVVSFYLGDRLVVKSLGARRPDIKNPSHRRLHNVAVEMALASGTPMPKLYVIDDPAPNAFAAGRDPENAVIGVTGGLLDIMDRDELQAVVAHEFGHIRNYDIRTMTVVAVCVGTVAVLSDWAVRTWRYGGVASRRRKGAHPLVLIPMVVLVLLSPLISRIIAMAVSRSREYQADVSAAEFTRNPAALARALAKIAHSTIPVKGVHRGTAHLFIHDPMRRRLDDKEGRYAELLATHPPIKKRIERLEKMAYIWSRTGKSTGGAP